MFIGIQSVSVSVETRRSDDLYTGTSPDGVFMCEESKEHVPNQLMPVILAKLAEIEVLRQLRIAPPTPLGLDPRGKRMFHSDVDDGRSHEAEPKSRFSRASSVRDVLTHIGSRHSANERTTSREAEVSSRNSFSIRRLTSMGSLPVISQSVHELEVHGSICCRQRST